MKKEEAVFKTIETYEAVAEEFYKRHSDISEVKDIADFFLKSLKGKKILDIGCGPGRDAKYFSSRGFEVTGIDVTLNFLKIASKNVPHAKFIQKDMRDLDFSENAFDGIWASASLLHIPKAEAKDTLRGFWRALKLGGLLFVSVKEGASEELVETPEYPAHKRFFAFWRENEIKALIESSGFKIQKAMVQKKKYLWIAIFATKEGLA